MNEIIVKPDSDVTKERVIDFAKTLGLDKNLEPNELSQYIEICTAYQLNPFKREIYCVAYGQGQYRKLSIIVGYEVYLKRAERTGKMDGWEVDIEGTGEDMYAKVTIYRKDWTHPFTHKAYWSECKQETYDKEKKTWRLNSMWEKMGKFMLKKVATAQAFRLCFPDEMGGLPYTADELPENMTTEVKNITPEPAAIPENTEKKKGDFTQAAKLINESKNLKEITKYEELIKHRAWSEEEYQMLQDSIRMKKELLEVA